jgi:hypothetical protein
MCLPSLIICKIQNVKYGRTDDADRNLDAYGTEQATTKERGQEYSLCSARRQYRTWTDAKFPLNK